MKIDMIKKLIKDSASTHDKFLKSSRLGWRYYTNDPDFLHEAKDKAKEEISMRSADNRIPFNFHGLLVNQKASYLFSTPPLIDLGSSKSNKQLSAWLGDKYTKVCKDLCIEASNSSIAWLHLWQDNKLKYKYATVPAEQIYPIWSSSLDKELIAVLRIYTDIDNETGERLSIYEYWDSEHCRKYSKKSNASIEEISSMPMFHDEQGTPYFEYRHGMGEIPFFPFHNNNIQTGDLNNIKKLIDVYCKIYSGFVNDLEDIQEVIFVLTNYGGADLGTFLRDLKYFKTIKIDSEDSSDKSGVSTLTIDIPIEAREKLLEITRKCIFEQGQGIDPDPKNFGNQSGVALNFLYALLELKAGLMEVEFRPSLARFIRCICRLSDIKIKNDIILQTWTRTSVRNDIELAQIAMQSRGIISAKTIVERHPWVDDPSVEIERLAEEKSEEIESFNILPDEETNPDIETKDD